MADGRRLRYNLVSDILAAGLTAGATTIEFANAPPFETLNAGELIALTIGDIEVVHLTSYTSGATTGTIERGQEGSTAVAHSAGDTVVHGPTKQDFLRDINFGHPAQPWEHGTHFVQLTPTHGFDYEFDPGDGSGYRYDFEELSYQPGSTHEFTLPQFGTAGHLPDRFRLTLRWYAPIAGTFNLDYEGELGNFDITVTTNGVADTTFTNNADGTYSIAVPQGDNEVQIVYENVSGGVTGSAASFQPYVTPDVTPLDGEVFLDDQTGALVMARDGGYVPVGSMIPDGISGGTAFSPSGSFGVGADQIIGSGATASYRRGVSIFGRGVVSNDILEDIIAIGTGATAASFPEIGGGYGYSIIAIGARAEAWTGGIAIGSGVLAGPLAVGIGGDAEDESVAIGVSSWASVPKTGTNASPVSGSAVAASGTPGAHGTYIYSVRCVDTDGFPLSEWDSFATLTLADQHASITWPTSGWPAGATDVEIQRTNAGESTYLRGTIASGGLTDDFSTFDRVPSYVGDSIAFIDWYGWGRDRRAIAIGYGVGARHKNSVVIDNDDSLTTYDGQFILGNVGNIVERKGGDSRRVESVTTTFTCDSNGFSNVVLADASGGVFTITLPAALDGRTITIKKSDGGANAVTVATPGSETIDGSADDSLAAAYESATYVSDGTNWFII